MKNRMTKFIILRFVLNINVIVFSNENLTSNFFKVLFPSGKINTS